jgi:hypothetical protein
MPLPVCWERSYFTSWDKIHFNRTVEGKVNKANSLHFLRLYVTSTFNMHMAQRAGVVQTELGDDDEYQALAQKQ